MGALGASYLGWAVAEAGWLLPVMWEQEEEGDRILTTIPATITLSKGQRQWRWQSGTAAIFMFVLPVLWIAFSY